MPGLEVDCGDGHTDRCQGQDLGTVNGHLSITDDMENISGCLEKHLSVCTVRTWPQGTLLSRDSCLTHATYTTYLRTAHLTNLTHLRGKVSKTSCQDAFSEDISIDLSSTALFSLPVPLILLHFH